MNNRLQCMERLVELFEQYSGDDNALDRKEFRAMMEKELQGKVDTSDVDKIFGKLDKNDDGKLDLDEYIKIIGLLIKHIHCKKTGKGCGK
ncbi:protein S100-A11-like [Syngnathoides biaculeatus]|uniref:protein S100-A11-like n=1 Tax=Syngnathoides biaculeatus TaxID=300417 RepID=UPI002ADE5404|nr:protein S100-A11-like [Syngnathoides biaculeatus]XP_061676771.1 protein S100-A11-like [Syngnathoides biaculeatus]